MSEEEYWLSTKHLTLGFVERMLVNLNQFLKNEGDMNGILFVLLEKDNPVDQMLTGKFTVQMQPKREDSPPVSLTSL